MKLTKYEYKHNPNGNRKIDRLSNYFPPKIRIIIICVMYITMLFILLDIFKNFNIVASIIEIVVVILFSVFVIEHNPLFIVSFLIRALYYIFSKNSVHKKMVYNLLNDYRNVIAFEKKNNISNVRISFLDPQKILYSKNDKRGYISLKYVKLDEKVVANEYSNYEKTTDYIHYLKFIITELYKK